MSRGLAIKAENISKKYQLGKVSSGSFREIFSKRSSSADNEFLALDGIDFELEHGDVLGVVGKNGAGKSTLLKVLSRITQPSTGRIEIEGRISSLLEVGTGFHPELTGRENIFLNGTILGMTRKEVKSKFDEIVEFSGVAKFLDTPVKRYSSGMYVRLAFAVAAHLEPEILIIDEVLAVGDAEFQKKCLGKMKDVAGQGRTVIFVSHNIQAVESLCNKGLLLEKGKKVLFGDIDQVVSKYLKKDLSLKFEQEWTSEEAPGNDVVKMRSMRLVPSNETDIIDVDTSFNVEIECDYQGEYDPVNLSLLLNNEKGTCVFNIISNNATISKGQCKGVLTIPGKLLNDGYYSIDLHFVHDTSKILHTFSDIMSFQVIEQSRKHNWYGKWQGAVRPDLKFIFGRNDFS